MMAGSATVLACDQAIEKGRRGAAHLFEADVGDIEFADGTFRVVGTDRAIPILELAQRMRATRNARGALSGGLDNVAKFVSPQMSFPNGCHVCEVEIDPQTGVVAVVGLHGGRRRRQRAARDHRGGTDPRRRGAGPRAGAGRAGDLRRRRPAADGVVHGLLHAARRRPAAHVGRAPRRAVHDQPARRQGRRRVRASPARCRRRSTPCSTRWRAAASPIWTCR